jgi:hypothetical protein
MEMKKERKKERKIDFFLWQARVIKRHVLRTMMYRFNGHKISEGINQCYLLYSKKDFQCTNLLIFQVLRKAAVVQGISSSEWCLRSIPPCARTLLYFHAEYRGKIPEV